MKKLLLRYPKEIWIALWLLMGPLILHAQDEPELDPVSRTYAITHVNVVQSPGRKIDRGTVVIKNGLILAVGQNISIPAEAVIIKADSMYVYAGFIDGLSNAGLSKPREEQSRERPKDPGNPTPERAGITPETNVHVALNPEEKSLEELRSVGFTAAHVVPYGGMLPGKGSVIFLGGTSADAMMLQQDISFYSALSPAERVYPGTVMGVMAVYRDLYRQASLVKSYSSVYASNRSGLERPVSNRILEAFFPVIDRKLPVFFRAEKVLDIHRVLTLQKDLGFSLMLGDVKEGWDVIGKIKGYPIFLSLELPEEKKDEKKDGDKKDVPKKDDVKKEEPKPEEKKEEKPTSPAELEKERLEKRKADFILKYVSQPLEFQKAGVRFGFSTLTAKPKDIPGNLRRIIKAGLSEDAALAALTVDPAQLLGLSDRLGTVDQGKIANLVITDKPYFNEKANVRYVFVDGRLYKQEVKDTKKTDPNANSAADGTWTMTAETSEGKSESSVTISKNGDVYSGKISGGRITSPKDLESISFTGKNLKFAFTMDVDGQEIVVTVDVTIDGDTFKGSAVAGQLGTFPVEGTRNPKK